MKTIILTFIKLYQKTLSPNHGILKHYPGVYKCKFHPTCSEYTYKAIEKYGVFKGFFISLNRILRCHPWSDGGYDPLL